MKISWCFFLFCFVLLKVKKKYHKTNASSPFPAYLCQSSCASASHLKHDSFCNPGTFCLSFIETRNYKDNNRTESVGICSVPGLQNTFDAYYIVSISVRSISNFQYK